MQHEPHLQAPHTQSRVSMLLRSSIVIISGLIICFGAILILSYLSASKLSNFSERESFKELYHIKEASLPQHFNWLYSDALNQREERLDRSILRQAKETYLSSLVALSQRPLSMPPQELFHSVEIIKELMSQSDLLQEWSHSGRWSTSVQGALEDHLGRCRALLETLKALATRVSGVKDHSTALKTKNSHGGQEAMFLHALANDEGKAQKLHGQSPQAATAIQRYTFAWYRHWAESALHSLTRDPSTLVATTSQADLTLERLRAIQFIYRHSATLSSELSALIHFKVLRANEYHWNFLWQLTATLLKQNKIERAHLKALEQFASQLSALGHLRRHAEQIAADPTSLPPNVRSEWERAITSISDITFAEAILSAGFDQHAQRKDYSKLWFISSLSEARLDKIEIEMSGVKLRTLLRKALDVSAPSQAKIRQLSAQVDAMKELNIPVDPWRARLKSLEELFKPRWRSFRGHITCDPKALDVDSSWRDLGPLDKLSPSMYVVSKGDKALVSHRTGRLNWSIYRHMRFKIRVYDEDRLSDPDLLFIEPMPSILDMILSRTVSRHGCRYRVELLNQKPLTEWLSD